MICYVQVLKEQERTHARKADSLQRARAFNSETWRRQAGLDSVFRRGSPSEKRRDTLSYLRDLGLVGLGAAFATALWSCWHWISPQAAHRRRPSGAIVESESFARRLFSCCFPQRAARSWGPAVQNNGGLRPASQGPWQKRDRWQGGVYGGHGASAARPPTSKLLMQGCHPQSPESPPLRSLAS